MSVQRVFLVIDAAGRVRAAKRPQIRADEVAIQINLRFPDKWGRVVQALDLEVPDFAPTAEAVSDAEG